MPQDSNNDFELILKRSRRKTIALEVTPEGDLIIRAPQRTPDAEILAFARAKHNRKARRKTAEAKAKHEAQAEYERTHPEEFLTDAELRELGEMAADYIPMRVAHYAAVMDLDFGRITIRNQRSRWGSCSAKGNLNFNVLLMLTPPEVIDSVIVHELCHLRHMDHSPAFYEEVLRYFPEYRRWDKWLKKNGGALMRRMPSGRRKRG